MKYAMFIVKKVEHTQRLARLFHDRTSEEAFLSMIQNARFSDVSLVCLQLLCDFLVTVLSAEKPSTLLLEPEGLMKKVSHKAIKRVKSNSKLRPSPGKLQ